MRGTPKRQVLLGSKAPTWKVYKDCRLPLDIFMECLFDKDYSRIVRSGHPPKHIVLDSWGKIYVEYADIVNEGDPNALFTLTIKINYLAAKLFIIDKCVKHFGISWNDEIYKILRYYGVAFGIKETDTLDQRMKKLSRTTTRANRWKVDLDIMWTEFEKLQSEAAASNGGMDSFESNLLNISAFRKYAVLAKDISVRQYIKTMKSMEQEAVRLMAKSTY